MKPHRGVMILVFGILGFVLCPFFGIAAWVMGNSDLQEMDSGWMDPTGREPYQSRSNLRNDCDRVSNPPGAHHDHGLRCDGDI